MDAACANAEIWLFLKFWSCVHSLQPIAPCLSAFPEHQFLGRNHVFPEHMSTLSVRREPLQILLKLDKALFMSVGVKGSGHGLCI